MPDPGQTAYEARFTDEDRRRRYANEWDRLGPLERATWARVEAASINAIGRVLAGDDRISASLRTINFEVASIKAAATQRVEAAEARLAEAVEHIRTWVAWCDGPAQPHPFDNVQAAKAFLSKLGGTNA